MPTDSFGPEARTADEWYQDGQRLRSSGRYAEAVSAFSRAIERNRLFAEAYFGRGTCHYALRHYQQAREDLNAAAVFGCRVAQFWSRFEIKVPDEPEEPDEADDPEL
jgi:tetratricopeptide (TPR) repeat protein